jgi:hypothetical protein
MYIKVSDLIVTDVFGVTSTTTYSHLGLQVLPHTFVLADESNKIRSKPDTASLLLASVCGGMLWPGVGGSYIKRGLKSNSVIAGNWFTGCGGL